MSRTVEAVPWLLAALGTLILWGVWGVALKIVSDAESWNRVYVTSNLAVVLAVAVMLAYYTPKGAIILDGKYALLALAAGFAGTLGYFLLIMSMKLGGKASIVIPLTSLYPVVTVALSRIVLGEEISVKQYIGIIMAIIAILFISSE